MAEEQTWRQKHGGSFGAGGVTIGFATAATLSWLLIVKPLQEKIDENKDDLKDLREEFSYYKGLWDSGK